MEQRAVISRREVHQSFLIQYKACINCLRKHVYFLCHDYLPEKRRYLYAVKRIFRRKKTRIFIFTKARPKHDFVEMRNKRDASFKYAQTDFTFDTDQYESRTFPEPEENGVSDLKLPLNYFK